MTSDEQLPKETRRRASIHECRNALQPTLDANRERPVNRIPTIADVETNDSEQDLSKCGNVEITKYNQPSPIISRDFNITAFRKTLFGIIRFDISDSMGMRLTLIRVFIKAIHALHTPEYIIARTQSTSFA